MKAWHALRHAAQESASKFCPLAAAYSLEFVARQFPPSQTLVTRRGKPKKSWGRSAAFTAFARHTGEKAVRSVASTCRIAALTKRKIPQMIAPHPDYRTKGLAAGPHSMTLADSRRDRDCREARSPQSTAGTSG